jgi:3-phenylpropionate/trans-cinnamate dioxygenase ferredoxin subunit/naphthalene 1,2-dioxygenase system ferredoxin subunit
MPRLCNHGSADLCDGYFDGHVIECPRHNGLFDIRTGQALRAPACVHLKTHELSIEDGKIFLHITPVD